MNELKIVQPLVITGGFDEIKAKVEERVNTALNLAVSIDNVKEVKKYKAELNNELKALEDERKRVKAEALKPYNEWEQKYKECVSIPYKEAEQKLKGQITEIEDLKKKETLNEIKDFFNGYLLTKSEEVQKLAKYENMNIKILISSNIKKLRETCTTYIDNVERDVSIINNQQYADEVMYEYSKCHNVALSIQNVVARHNVIDNPKETPAEVKTKVEVKGTYDCTFTIKGATIEQLQRVKAFLESEGLTYEC
jgi:hypothetical protein